MLANLFAPLAMKIGGGIIAALVLALGLTMWRADSISGQRDAMQQALANERAGHAVTIASLDALQAELQEMVDDGTLREERLQEAQEAQEVVTQSLEAQAAQIAASAPNVTCETVDAVLNAEGL